MVELVICAWRSFRMRIKVQCSICKYIDFVQGHLLIHLNHFSVKWVGLFAVALVGTYTIDELWDMLGNLHMPKKIYLSHWLARGVCLIALPLSIYVATFVVHFYLLTNSGPGDAHMNSLFQARLNGSAFGDNPFGKHD